MAIYDLKGRKSVQVATVERPAVEIGDEGDGPYGIAQPGLAYELEAT